MSENTQPQERDIEEIAEAISRYESDMVGAFMWEALDEQERGYYLDMVRVVFAACPRLRAQPSPREVALEKALEEIAKIAVKNGTEDLGMGDLLDDMNEIERLCGRALSQERFPLLSFSTRHARKEDGHEPE